jgi:hypothetical protein
VGRHSSQSYHHIRPLQCLDILIDTEEKYARQTQKSIQIYTVYYVTFSPLTKITLSENGNTHFHLCFPPNTDSVVTLAFSSWRPIVLLAEKEERNKEGKGIINAATQLRKEQRQLLYGEESSQATTNQLVAATMDIQSERRKDAGGVAFISIETCAVCKAKHLISRGITTRIPKQAHHKACSKNLKTRGASERSVFVNQKPARKLAANRAAIANKTTTYQGFSAARTNHRPTNRVTTTVRPSTTTATATATASTGLSTTTAVLIADPTSDYVAN